MYQICTTFNTAEPSKNQGVGRIYEVAIVIISKKSYPDLSHPWPEDPAILKVIMRTVYAGGAGGGKDGPNTC